MTLRRALVAIPLLLLAGTTPLVAEVELTPLVGFQLGGGFETREGDLIVDPAANLGLVASVRTRHDGLVELLYSRQSTTLELEGVLGSGDLFDLTVEYYHFGGLWEIETDRSRPFLGLTVGGTRLAPDVPDVDAEWAFSAGISGGLKYFFADRLGVRLEGRGLLSFFGSGGAIFCGYPPGQCGLTVSGSSFLQLDILAGLVVRF